MTSDDARHAVGTQQEVRECPFDGCDWTSRPYDPDDYCEDLSSDHEATMHYEQEHAGRVKVRVTLELEQLLGDRDPTTIADRFHDKMEDNDDLLGWDVAYAVAEVVEESDPHPERDRSE